MSAVRKIDSNIIELWSEKYNSFADDLERCIVCGKKTSAKIKGLGLIIGDGGYSIIHPDDNDQEMTNNGAGYMGWYPVGSECIKVVPVEFRTKINLDIK